MSEPLETKVAATVLGGPQVRATVSEAPQVNAVAGEGIVVNAPESGGIEVLVDPLQGMNISAEAVGGVEVNATAEGGVEVTLAFGGSSGGGGSGTVTSVSVTTANGVSGSVANPTTTPAISLTLGNIAPTSVAATGNVTGANLSGNNTGDQTNISGNAATVTTNANLTGVVTSVGNSTSIGNAAITNAMLVNAAVANLSGTNSGDQTIALTGDVTGSGAGSFATTLANTAVTPGAYTAANITVDSKGRITAAANGGAGTGDVIGPATNTDNLVPQWNGANSKTLKDGLSVSQGSNGASDSTKLAQYNASGWLHAANFYAQASPAATAYSHISPTGLTFANTTGGIDIQAPSTLTELYTQTLSRSSGTILVGSWVNFDGTSAANVSGTYSRTSPSTTLTVTLTAHGHIVGHVVYLDFTTGTGVDGLYTITGITDADNYTVTTVASTTTSGNVTELRRTIRGSSGVHSVTNNITGGLTGSYFINFSTAMADANYSYALSAGEGTNASAFVLVRGPSQAAKTAQSFRMQVTTTAATYEPQDASATFFR